MTGVGEFVDLASVLGWCRRAWDYTMARRVEFIGAHHMYGRIDQAPPHLSDWGVWAVLRKPFVLRWRKELDDCSVDLQIKQFGANEQWGPPLHVSWLESDGTPRERRKLIAGGLYFLRLFGRDETRKVGDAYIYNRQYYQRGEAPMIAPGRYYIRLIANDGGGEKIGERVFFLSIPPQGISNGRFFLEIAPDSTRPDRYNG